MGIGVGLVFVAVGAILAFAVDVSHSHGFNINTVGWILMGVGVVGVLLDLLLFMPRRRTGSSSVVVREHDEVL
jgi:protein-S-isoprenylcysteine O-methyltransferase Ste14